MYVHVPTFTLGYRGYFFAAKFYQTVSTVYFILGILKTDLWSLGSIPDKFNANKIYWNLCINVCL